MLLIPETGPVSVTGRRSITNPGFTPVPTRVALYFLARESNFLAAALCLCHGNAISSQVETTEIPASTASRICSLVVINDELAVWSNTSTEVCFRISSSEALTGGCSVYTR